MIIYIVYMYKILKNKDKLWLKEAIIWGKQRTSEWVSYAHTNFSKNRSRDILMSFGKSSYAKGYIPWAYIYAFINEHFLSSKNM